MSLISRDRVALAAWVIDESDAAELMAEALAGDKRGRKGRPLIHKHFLMGVLLAYLQGAGRTTAPAIHKVLTESISIHEQFEFGIRRMLPDGSEDQISLHQIQRLSKRLPLAFGSPLAPTETPEVHLQAGRDQLAEIVRRLVRTTLIVPSVSSTFAVDGSGIWSWGRGKRGPVPEGQKFEDNDREASRSEPVEDCIRCTKTDRCRPHAKGRTWKQLTKGLSQKEIEDLEERTPNSSMTRSTSSDPQGGWGGKTKKDGTTELFFGYEFHALVRTRPGNTRHEPLLVEAMAVTPAGIDIVAPTLGLLDDAAANGSDVKDLIGDRHYSYKLETRWARELRARGINQHLDLHPNDLGFTDLNGARMAAGVPHCAATPDRLGSISRPGPTAAATEMQVFIRDITEREQYAAVRRSSPDVDGKARYTCPARAGLVGCELVPGTVEAAISAGLEITKPPSDHATRKICSQETFTVDSLDHAKLAQPHYWGSQKWATTYAQRSKVEGFFGVIKNESRENVHRGQHQLVGIVHNTLMLALASVAYNINELRNWHEETDAGPADHPILAKEVGVIGWIAAKPEDVIRIGKEHLVSDAA